MRTIRWVVRFPFRVLGLGFMVLAVLAAGLDIFKTVAAGEPRATALGTLWFNVDPGSLNLSQAVTQRYIHPAVWDPGVQWLLERPVWFSFALVALVLLAIAWVLRPGRRRGAA